MISEVVHLNLLKFKYKKHWFIPSKCILLVVGGWISTLMGTALSYMLSEIWALFFSFAILFKYAPNFLTPPPPHLIHLCHDLLKPLLLFLSLHINIFISIFWNTILKCLTTWPMFTIMIVFNDYSSLIIKFVELT